MLVLRRVPFGPGRDLKLAQVTKRYGSAAAVADISQMFPGGSYVCLRGPSGCGKSPTLRMTAGHETVTDGGILLSGKDVTVLPPAMRCTAMMFQSYALFPHLSVTDNVAFSLKIRGVDVRQFRAFRVSFDESVNLMASGVVVFPSTWSPAITL